MSREQIFEVFTINGWFRVDRETYWEHRGSKRWRFDDEDEWHGGGGYDPED